MLLLYEDAGGFLGDKDLLLRTFILGFFLFVLFSYQLQDCHIIVKVLLEIMNSIQLQSSTTAIQICEQQSKRDYLYQIFDFQTLSLKRSFN